MDICGPGQRLCLYHNKTVRHDEFIRKAPYVNPEQGHSNKPRACSIVEYQLPENANADPTRRYYLRYMTLKNFVRKTANAFLTIKYFKPIFNDARSGTAKCP